MNAKNKLVSTHHVGRGVSFDCAEWDKENSSEQWSRGQLVSTHLVGTGVTYDCSARLQLELTLTLTPDADRVAIRQKLEELAADVSEIDASLGGNGFRVEENQAGEQPNQSYRFVLSTLEVGAIERVKMLASLLAVLAARSNGKNTARVRVLSLDDAGTARFEMAA